LANAVGTECNAGTTNPSARILLRDAGNVLLATCTMSNPAFGTSTNGTISPGTITGEASAPAAGTVTKFEVINRAAAVVFSGTVTATGGGGDLTINRTSISVGDTVSVVSFSYTASA
jgi:hypothetical protein